MITRKDIPSLCRIIEKELDQVAELCVQTVPHKQPLSDDETFKHIMRIYEILIPNYRLLPREKVILYEGQIELMRRAFNEQEYRELEKDMNKTRKSEEGDLK
jgi:hypothetical protein